MYIYRILYQIYNIHTNKVFCDQATHWRGSLIKKSFRCPLFWSNTKFCRESMLWFLKLISIKYGTIKDH